MIFFRLPDKRPFSYLNMINICRNNPYYAIRSTTTQECWLVCLTHITQE